MKSGTDFGQGQDVLVEEAESALPDVQPQEEVVDPEKVGLFTREDLLGMQRKFKKVVPPGYTGAVEIQSLTAWEQSEYQSSLMHIEFGAGKMTTTPDMVGSEPKLLALGVKDPKLTAKEWGELPNDFVAFVSTEIRELSGMAVTVEEAEGN